MKNLKIYLIALTCFALIFQGCCTTHFLTVKATGGGSTILGSSSWKPKVAFSAGADLCLMELSDVLSLSGGIEGSSQGAAWDDYGYSGHTDLFYINAPFLLKYQTQKGFFGEVGLQPGILLSAKDKYDGGSYDYLDYMNKLDIGIPLVLGYVFKNNLGVGVKVAPGLLNIVKEDESSDRNLLFGITVSYRIKSGK